MALRDLRVWKSAQQGSRLETYSDYLVIFFHLKGITKEFVRLKQDAWHKTGSTAHALIMAIKHRSNTTISCRRNSCFHLFLTVCFF